MSGIIIAVIFFVIGFFVSVVINIIVSGSEKEKIKNFITIYKEYDVKITDSSCGFLVIKVISKWKPKII